MASKPSLNVDFSELQEKLVGQFRNLDPKDPSLWPATPRYALFLAIAAVCVVVLWFLWLSTSQEELVAEQAKEVQLRDEYKINLTKAVNLEALVARRVQD